MIYLKMNLIVWILKNQYIFCSIHFVINLISYGIIKTIQNSNIAHLCSTEKGFSGSPILNLANNKVIGIHQDYHEIYDFNIGSILNNSINLFKYCKIQKSKKKQNIL